MSHNLGHITQYVTWNFTFMGRNNEKKNKSRDAKNIGFSLLMGFVTRRMRGDSELTVR